MGGLVWTKHDVHTQLHTFILIIYPISIEYMTGSVHPWRRRLRPLYIDRLLIYQMSIELGLAVSSQCNHACVTCPQGGEHRDRDRGPNDVRASDVAVSAKGALCYCSPKYHICINII